MIFCLFYIICDHVFKRQHSVHIQIPGAGNQVFLIGIFSGELKTDQMTPVVQIFSVYIIVFCILPSGRLHLTDALTLFCRHEVHSDSGACSTASAQPVQFTVKFIGLSGQIIF